jgi:hypothetical protein
VTVDCARSSEAILIVLIETEIIASIVSTERVQTYKHVIRDAARQTCFILLAIFQHFDQLEND